MALRNHTAAILLALGLPALLLVSGCGGGSTSGSSSASTGAARTAGSAPAGTSSTSSTSSSTGTSTAPAQAQPGSTSSAVVGGQGAVATANAICARRNKELAAIQDPGTKRLSALAAVSRRRAGIVQRALDELEKLTPPAAIAGQYRKILLANQSTLLAMVKVGEAAKAGDAAATRAAKARERPTQLPLLFTAVRAGLKSCAGLPSGSAPAGLPIP